MKHCKKKILFIHHAAGWGGAPNSMVNLITSLDAEKYDVEVLLLKKSIVAEKLAEKGIKYKIADSDFYKHFYKYYSHTVPGHTKWYRLIKLTRLAISWLFSRYYFAPRILKNYTVDIIHLNSSTLTDWLKPCKKAGKVIMHVREPFSNGALGLRANIFRAQMKKYADCIITISQDNAKRIDIPEKTVVIYNYSAVPENVTSQNAYASQKALYLGGAAKIKGFYTMVESLDYLNKDVKIYFGGNYVSSKSSFNGIRQIIKSIIPSSRKQNAAVRKINNHPNAIVLGITNNVGKYLDEVCCLISPFSVPHFSRPVIEAHLHKKPVIATDIEGIDEIVHHEVNGLIIPKDNPRELAAAINTLTSTPKKAKILGEAGYVVAVKKFTPKNIEQFQLIYEKLLFL